MERMVLLRRQDYLWTRNKKEKSSLQWCLLEHYRFWRNFVYIWQKAMPGVFYMILMPVHLTPGILIRNLMDRNWSIQKRPLVSFNCILCIDWLETEVDNNWSVHDKAFLSDVTSLGFHAIYDTLTEAQKKCVELSSSDCRGVTFTGWPSKGWQLRRGNIPKQSPDCEISFIRPST